MQKKGLIFAEIFTNKNELDMETNNLKSLDGGTINSAINENVNDFTRVMNQVDNNIEKTEMRTEDMQPDKNGKDKNGQTAETQVLTPGNSHVEKGEEEYCFPTVEELLCREREDILSLRRLPYTVIVMPPTTGV